MIDLNIDDLAVSRLTVVSKTKKENTMTMATTDIRIDYTMLPESFDLSRKDVIIEVIMTELRQGEVSAYAMDELSHLKIEVPTAQLARACKLLAEMELI